MKRCALLLTVCFSSACTAPLVLENYGIHVAPHPGTPRVLIIKSSDSPLYQEPVGALVEQIGGNDVTVYTMPEAIDIKAWVRRFQQEPAAAVVTLGTRATLMAREAYTTTPVVFFMMADYQHHHLENVSNFAGIDLDLPPLANFIEFRMVVPKMNKVLVFYNAAQSQARIDEATHALIGINLALHAVPVETAAEVPALYQSRKKTVDAIWLMDDPVVMNENTFQYLRDATLNDHLPLCTGLSDKLAEDGALMSIAVDPHALGSQAATMVELMLDEKVPPHALGIRHPIGSSFTLNLNTARRIGVKVPTTLMPLINRVVGSR